MGECWRWDGEKKSWRCNEKYMDGWKRCQIIYCFLEFFTQSTYNTNKNIIIVALTP